MKFLNIMCGHLSVLRSVLRGVCYIFFHVYFQFILVAAFILDVGRVMFGRGVYKIKGFSCTMI